MIDFKISRMIDDGSGITALIRYYEGSVTTENELDDETRLMVPVTRYRRTKMLGGKEISIIGTPTKEDVITMAKVGLKKFKGTPIPEQK